MENIDAASPTMERGKDLPRRLAVYSYGSFVSVRWMQPTHAPVEAYDTAEYPSASHPLPLVCVKLWAENTSRDQWIPMCRLFGMTEGTVFVWQCKRVELNETKDDLVYSYGPVRLILQQAGEEKTDKTDDRFEQALLQHSASFGGCCRPAGVRDVSESCQRGLLLQAHNAYAASVGLPAVPPEKFLYSERV